MVAYHFPPLTGSSGIQRTLRFVQHLPSLGWQPLVLSANALAYELLGNDLLGGIPADTVVRRAFALDTARHLSLRGRYLSWMALPDRWVSWKFAAIREGRRMIREFKPDVIWSTYPIATAHVIAAALHRTSKIPWVADFRDPMAHHGYPTDPVIWQSFARVQAEAIAHQQGSPAVKRARKKMRENPGEGNNTKLTVEKVKQIKHLLKENKTLKSIAAKYKVSDMQVYRIKIGENWKMVTI